MAGLTGWDIVILAVVAYVAVMSLVRLMRARRDALLAQFRAEMAAQRQPASGSDAPRTRNDRPPQSAGKPGR